MTENELHREATEAIDHIVVGAIKAMGAGFKKWGRVMDTVADQVEHNGLLEQAAALDAERTALTAELSSAKGLRAAAIRLRIAQINDIEAKAVAAAERALPALPGPAESVEPAADNRVRVNGHTRRKPALNGHHDG